MNLMIIGATGRIGGLVRRRLLDETGCQLTLAVRREIPFDAAREKLLIKSVSQLTTADLTGIDAVFASLSGDLPQLTADIVNLLENAGVKRLVQILTMGIYHEVPAKFMQGGGMSDYVRRYAEAAALVEHSRLDYTIIRPAWFDEGDETVDVTHKGETMTGHDVSVHAISKFVVNCLTEPDGTLRESFGLSRPEA